MAEFNGQTLGRYSPVAMKIKVGGGYDPYRGSFGFPVAETVRKSRVSWHLARREEKLLYSVEFSPPSWRNSSYHQLSDLWLLGFQFEGPPLDIFRCGWVATIWVKFWLDVEDSEFLKHESLFG
ncbi:hypothetical protein K0M31_010556, partial [Melipona bicolor]